MLFEPRPGGGGAAAANHGVVEIENLDHRACCEGFAAPVEVQVSPDSLRPEQDAARVVAIEREEDLQDGSLIRVTTAIGADLFPVWSPDGRRLAYGSGGMAERRLSIIAADATGTARELPCPGGAPFCEPTDWSPDGRHLIVNTRAGAGGTRRDVWSVSIEAGGSSEVILSGPFPQYDARISPDGRWLAYVSEETGRPEVHVRAMSGQPRRFVASNNGGSQPVWRRDGRELFYVDLEGQLRGRSVGLGDRTLGEAVMLEVPLIGAGHWGTQYDVSPDGQRVYFLDQTPAPRPSDINVAMGWQAFLR